jgi:hypothetical protein
VPWAIASVARVMFAACEDLLREFVNWIVAGSVALTSFTSVIVVWELSWFRSTVVP